jgi:hypothetical protein
VQSEAMTHRVFVKRTPRGCVLEQRLDYWKASSADEYDGEKSEEKRGC